MSQDGTYHVPVLLAEVIESLAIRPDGIYVDCTFGGGGHSRAILSHLNEQGRLIVFDQDQDARKNVPDDPRVLFLPYNFRHLARMLRLHRVEQVDGILADLGISSHQINVAERGFSTRFDAVLDMRMNQSESTTAADIVKTYSEEQLHRLFEQYGEVTNSKTLARTIVEARRSNSLETINQFKNVLFPVVKGNPERYLAQVFQALRIEVNEELEALKEMLQQSVQVLKPGGRIAIISFHSLEDRIVKNFFRHGNADGEVKQDVFGRVEKSPLSVITKKPVSPSGEELKRNPRARSSRLRVAEKRTESAI